MSKSLAADVINKIERHIEYFEFADPMSKRVSFVYVVDLIVTDVQFPEILFVHANKEKSGQSILRKI